MAPQANTNSKTAPQAGNDNAARQPQHEAVIIDRRDVAIRIDLQKRRRAGVQRPARRVGVLEAVDLDHRDVAKRHAEFIGEPDIARAPLVQQPRHRRLRALRRRPDTFVQSRIPRRVQRLFFVLIPSVTKFASTE